MCFAKTSNCSFSWPDYNLKRDQFHPVSPKKNDLTRSPTQGNYQVLHHRLQLLNNCSQVYSLAVPGLRSQHRSYKGYWRRHHFHPVHHFRPYFSKYHCSFDYDWRHCYCSIPSRSPRSNRRQFRFQPSSCLLRHWNCYCCYPCDWSFYYYYYCCHSCFWREIADLRCYCSSPSRRPRSIATRWWFPRHRLRPCRRFQSWGNRRQSLRRLASIACSCKGYKEERR